MWKWPSGHEKHTPIKLASFKSCTKRRTSLAMPVLLSHVFSSFQSYIFTYVLAFSLAPTWESHMNSNLCSLSSSPLWHLSRVSDVMKLVAKTSRLRRKRNSHTLSSLAWSTLTGCFFRMYKTTMPLPLSSQHLGGYRIAWFPYWAPGQPGP